MKLETRDTRGSTFKVLRDSTISKSFYYKTTTRLSFISEIYQCLTDIPTVVLSTQKVLSKTPVDLSLLEPFDHEEADNMIFVLICL